MNKYGCCRPCTFYGHQCNDHMRTGSRILNNFRNTNLHGRFQNLQRHFQQQYRRRAQDLLYFNCCARPNSFDASEQAEGQILQLVGEGSVHAWRGTNCDSISSELCSRAAMSCQDTQYFYCLLWCYCIGGKTWQVDQRYKMGGLGSILPQLSPCHSRPRWYPSEVNCTR